MEAIAKAKYIKGSPQKARLVIDLVRGKNVAKALAILKFTNKRAAGPIAKCIHSAIANATYKAEQENIAIDPDDLWIKTCFVDIGPTKNRRRLRPAPQGRAYFERRHFCHITVELTSEEPEVKDDKKSKKKAKAAGKVESGKKDTAKTDSKKTESKKADEVDEVKEEIIEKEASEVKETKSEKTAKEDSTAKTEEKSEAKAETAEKKADDKKADEKAEAKEDKTETLHEKSEEEARPKTEAEPIGTATPKNKPLAAQTDEEKTGTDEAAERQTDENEWLERQ
jgi:large subunit ribosomal protein L22